MTQNQNAVAQISNVVKEVRKNTFDLEDRTLAFAKCVIHLCQGVPKNTINHELVSQLVRASGSVGANYREANDALSKKDFSHRIKIAQREAKEAHYWLQLLREANQDVDHKIGNLIQEALELKKILAAISSRSR